MIRIWSVPRGKIRKETMQIFCNFMVFADRNIRSAHMGEDQHEEMRISLVDLNFLYP
jgi:hypothetical protein